MTSQTKHEKSLDFVKVMGAMRMHFCQAYGCDPRQTRASHIDDDGGDDDGRRETAETAATGDVREGIHVTTRACVGESSTLASTSRAA